MVVVRRQKIQWLIRKPTTRSLSTPICLFVCLFVCPIENITVVVSLSTVNILATVSTKLMRSCLDINQLGAPYFKENSQPVDLKLHLGRLGLGLVLHGHLVLHGLLLPGQVVLLRQRLEDCVGLFRHCHQTELKLGPGLHHSCSFKLMSFIL